MRSLILTAILLAVAVSRDEASIPIWDDPRTCTLLGGNIIATTSMGPGWSCDHGSYVVIHPTDCRRTRSCLD